MKLFRVDIHIPLAARKAHANRAALAVDSQRVCLAEAIYQTFAVILPVKSATKPLAPCTTSVRRESGSPPQASIMMESASL